MISVEEENSVTKVQFGLSVDDFWCSSCRDHPTWGSVKDVTQQIVVRTNVSANQECLKLYISLGSVFCFIS